MQRRGATAEEPDWALAPPLQPRLRHDSLWVGLFRSCNRPSNLSGERTPPPPVPTRPEINNRVTRKLRRFDSSECDKKKSITRLLSPSLPRDPDERKARRDGGRRARGNRGGEGVTGGGALIQSNVSD